MNEGTRRLLESLEFDDITELKYSGDDSLPTTVVARRRDQPYEGKEIFVELEVSFQTPADGSKEYNEYTGRCFVEQVDYGRFESVKHKSNDLEGLVKEINSIAMEMFHFFAV